MSADEFLVWAISQETGRYELFDGEVVSMAAERAAHARAKVEIFDRLRDAIRNAGAPCEVFADGMAVKVDDENIFEPDSLVRCGEGEALEGSATIVCDPVIVVEVLSSSTRATDSNLKLDQYFRIPSVHHNLIVRTTTPTVIHHRRTPEGFTTQLVAPGPLRLDPPGITLQLD